HIIAHGSDGSVDLGNTTLNADTLNQNQLSIALWANAFAEAGDILIYGCNLASTEIGQSLIGNLAELTLADIAASNDRTGHASEFGDWALEVSTGQIESSVALSEEAQSTWQEALSTYTVANTNDSGAGSLRQAIIDANANSGTDNIRFDISDALVGGAHTISLLSALPDITETVTIDGTTDSDFAGTPIIVLDGSGAGAVVNGLTLADGSGGSTVRGLVINQFGNNGIVVYSDGNTIEGNYIGTDISGSVDLGNTKFGIELTTGAENNTIGGTTAAQRNVISGNDSHGVILWGSTTTGNVVQGNYIGVNAAGTAALGNDDGIRVSGGANANIIGGDQAAGEGNVISGNSKDGVSIANSGTDNNQIYGNYIGTDYTGLVVVANARHGVLLYDGVQGTEVGGTGTGEGNVISGNTSRGVSIDGNGQTTSGNMLVANYIGVGSDGTTALGNGNDGIWIYQADDNVVGSTTAGNVIAANSDSGIEIGDSAGTIIQGNYVGTDSSATYDLGNSGSGVVLWGTTSGTSIGGTGTGEGNVIAHQTNNGVYLDESAGTGNSILGNRIYDNQLAIEFVEAGPVYGVTANDADDSDTGPNNLQNFPVITAAATAGSQIEISGTLDTDGLSQDYRIEFFATGTPDGSGHGEAERYLGFATITTDGSGDATFTATIEALVYADEEITATATVDNGDGTYGDTSEFAQNFTVTAATNTA
ncbi:MAG: DUF4347 domain-containing protein, partial [Sulfitobacter sp.]|nr:DUF4347 domain-containing protein [Sulfitobacter sp.]